MVRVGPHGLFTPRHPLLSYVRILFTMINVEVSRGNNENSLSLLRRFTKRVQGSGILPRVRSTRYSDRTISQNVKKKKTLKLIKRREEIQELIRMGKPVPDGKRRR
jgi:ribosomal protein S21